MEDVLPNVVSTGETSGDAALKEGDTPPLLTNSGRSSPPPDCAICLSRCRNKCFTDSCLHQFCFNCLLTWSKIKAECPLCKQPFKSIIHNVLSNNQYEEYLVEQEQQQQADEFIDLSALDVFLQAPRFRYTTTLTLHRRESLAIQRLLMRYPLVPALPPAPAPAPNPTVHRCQTLFRRSVYRHNLRARPLPDITGRYRECSSHFYRHNPAQMHRLVPWLKRELSVVAREAGRISLLAFIMEKLPRHDILSLEMERCLTPHLHAHTRHFLHELGCFASSPYDMVGYDRAVSYEPASRRLPAPVAPASETVSDTDSDIVLLSPSSAPGPSRSRRTLDSVVTIRTVSPSDTDDSSDGVVMVGYAAPPNARTPEVVDLLASDSDAVVVEEPDPPTAAVSRSPPSPQPSSSGLVKISLKRGHLRPAYSVTDEESDSDQNAKRSKRSRPLRKSRFVSRHSASTECTDRDTDSSSSDSSCTGVSLFSLGALSPYRPSGDRVESLVTQESSEDTTIRRSGTGRSSAASPCSRDTFLNSRRAKKIHKKSKRQSRSSRRSKSGTKPRRKEKLQTKSKNKRAPESSDTDDMSRWDRSAASGSNTKLHSHSKDRSPELPSTSGCSTLLDVVSDMVLAPDNTVLSVNRREGSDPRLMSPGLIPPAFSSLLNEINDDFFNQPGTSSLASPLESDLKPLYFSVKKEERDE